MQDHLHHEYRQRQEHPAIDAVRNDIAWLESRLNAIKSTGDCAYEHALARTYQRLLQQHRLTLDALLGD